MTRCNASSPSTPRASVRATITKASSRRASQAAFTFATISADETSYLPLMWPQRIGCTWSSMWMPAAPACSKARIVRRMLSALP